jgi:chromosome segregation ATPase
LAERAGLVRARAADVAERRATLPDEVSTVERAEADAREAAVAARAELEDATSRVAAVESARRPREEEIARAQRTAQDAREALADAESRLTRLADRRRELAELEQALRSEGAQLGAAATEVAAELAHVPRLSEGGKLVPGTTLAEIDEWGSRARAALFVVRGALESERERIVVEAEALGAAALGEDMHGTSVALVRRRLERALQ